MSYGEHTDFGSEILRLDDESIKLRKLLATNAALFRSACTDPAERLRLDSPVYGDFVYDLSVLHSNDMERIAKGTGIYIASRVEPVLLDIHDSEPEFGEEQVVHIQYGPDLLDVCRWTNALTRVVPTHMNFFDK